jgi:nitroreductase
MIQFLVWGLALVALAALAILYRAHRQGLFRAADPSLAAWTAFENRQHLRTRRLISAAVLAASPHNSQPWRFLVGENEILLHADFTRSLGAMDPFQREMFIGLGCALENIAIAAPGAGFAADIALLPDPKTGLAARVTLTPAAPSPHRLERVIARRRTDRGPYDTTRPVGGDAIHALQSELDDDRPFELLFFPPESAQAASFRELTMQAARDIVADSRMSRDSARWYRHDQRVIDTRRDGLTIQTQGFPPWRETLVRLLPQASVKTAHISWLRNTRMVQLATAMQIGMIVVPRDRLLDDRISLAIGRAWQRLHLKATELGLACQPINQIPERISRERQLGWAPEMQRALEQQIPLNGVPAFCFRMGFPTREAPHSPRRTVETVTETVNAPPV